jgi:phosphatidylglycerophosphate synthase
MPRDIVFSIFSEEEDGSQKRWRDIRDRLSLPFCVFFEKYHISPDFLSYAGLAMVIPFIYFFGFNPGLALFFILLNLFFDSLDGPLARHMKTATMKGAVTDIMSDHLSFFAFFLTFLYYGLLNQFWGAAYILNYALMLFLVIICRGLRIKFFPVIRSKYYVYIVFIIWLFIGHNYFDPLLVLFSVYMAVTNFFLFERIKCSLS